MKLRKFLIRFKFPVLIVLALAVPLAWASIHGKEQGKKRERVEREGEDKDALYPRLWEKMFLRGRQTRDGRPAAAHRQEAKFQALRLPVVRGMGGPAFMGLKPLPGIPPLGSSCDWTEMGPSPQTDTVSTSAYHYGNVSGRVTSLALDTSGGQTTLYVGTAYGGVWKSTNATGGSPSFTPISDPAQSLAVGAIALDPSHPSTLYVGSGELNMDGDSYYGVGIFRSPDGGNSWTLASTSNVGTFEGLACSKILVDPSNPATVLAAMGFSCCHSGLTNTNQGVYRSTDSGASWAQVITVNGPGQAIGGHSFTDLAYSASGTIFAAVRFQGVYASTDHGASWTQMASPFPSHTTPDTNNFARASLASRGTTLWCLVADVNDNPSKPGSGDTGLSQSTDGGNTWTRVILPTNVFGSGTDIQGTYDQYVAAPAGTNTLVVAGIDVFTATLPVINNNSWTNVTKAYGGGSVHPDQHAIALLDSNHWFVGNDGGVWYTTNAGSSFANLNTNLGTIQFYCVSPDPFTAGQFIGGSQDNGTALNHSNTGLTWTEWDGGDGGFNDASAAVAGQFYDENFGVGIFRSDSYGSDSFQTTVVDSTVVTDNASILVPFEALPGSPVSLIMGTSRVWKGPGVPSGNGAGWAALSGFLDGTAGNILILQAAPSNSSFIYATTTDNNNTTPAYHVFTNNGGGTWSNITGTLPTGSPIQGLAIDPTHPATVYVGVQGFVGSTGSGHVFESTNSGGAWTDITGNLPDAPVNWILVDPLFPGDLYVATDVGVFATQSVNGASTSWAQLGTKLPDSTVLTLKMASPCPRMIVAGTHGRGAWSICPLDSSCPPTATPTITPTPTNTPTATPTDTPCGWPGPTCTPTPTPLPPAVFSALAEPNVTDGQTPVNFLVNLPAPALITLSVYDIAGEEVYSTSMEGALGTNPISWPPKNQGGQALASGIYIYAVQAGGGQKIGKIYVHH